MYKYLSADNRRTMEKLLNEGSPMSDIAWELGCSLATVYREKKRGEDSQGRYSAARGIASWERAKRGRGWRRPAGGEKSD